MRILGLDIGTHSIKAVETESAFGRYDIQDYHDQPLELTHEPDQAIRDALRILIKKLVKTPDQIIVAMPTHQTTLRNLYFPTRAKKALQSGINFELEDELPFSMEESAYDYTILGQDKKGSSTHIAVSLKKNINHFLHILNSAGVDPDYLTTEAWGYRSLMNRILTPLAQLSPTLLVHIGRSKTILYLHHKNQPVLIISFPWGDSDLAQAISKKYEIPLDQAHSIRMDQGSYPLSSLQTPEQIELSQCIENASHALLVELKQISLTSKNITKHEISAIYITGGTSLTPGMKEWLETHIEIPVSPLLSLTKIHPSGVNYSEETDAQFALAAGLTLSLVGQEKNQCINFRKGIYNKTGKGSALNLSNLKKPLLSLSVITLSMLISLVVQSYVYESQLTKANHLLEKSIQGLFGNISKSAIRTYTNNTKALKTSMKKELDKQRDLNLLFGANPTSPLDFFNTISSRISKDITADLSHMSIGGGADLPYDKLKSSQKASFTFIVSNPQMAEKLSNTLKNHLKNLEKSKMEEIQLPDKTDTKWKITFSGIPEENSYGF